MRISELRAIVIELLINPEQIARFIVSIVGRWNTEAGNYQNSIFQTSVFFINVQLILLNINRSGL